MHVFRKSASASCVANSLQCQAYVLVILPLFTDADRNAIQPPLSEDPDKERRLPFRGKLAFLGHLPHSRRNEPVRGPERRAAYRLGKPGALGVVSASGDSDCEAYHFAP